MRNSTGRDTREVAKIAAAGVILLLLFGVPGCSAREIPDLSDWSKIEAIPPDTKTEVQVSAANVPMDQETEGEFHAATGDSLTLRFEDVRTYTFQKSDVYSVSTYRPVSERWGGWATLVVSSVIAAYLLRGDTEGAPLALLPIVALPTAIAFYGSASMKEIYRTETEENPK